jgi:tRNA(adenine34) deaminase
MCVGALVHARVPRSSTGRPNRERARLCQRSAAASCPRHNHRFEVVAGINEDECRALMQAFFKHRRP